MNLSGLNSAYIRALLQGCPAPLVEPEGSRDQWLWDASRRQLVEDIARGAGWDEMDIALATHGGSRNSLNSSGDAMKNSADKTLSDGSTSMEKLNT